VVRKVVDDAALASDSAILWVRCQRMVSGGLLYWLVKQKSGKSPSWLAAIVARKHMKTVGLGATSDEAAQVLVL
jgi:hypothetical protein